MVKKVLKPHKFIETNFRFAEPDVYTLESDITVFQQQYPNEWGVNLNGEQRLVLDGQGDMRITGRIHALGSVIWNQESQRLEFWDGTMWQHLIGRDIV